MQDTGQILVIWCVLAFLVGAWAVNRGKTFWSYFLLSLVLSPLIGVIVLLASSGSGNSEPRGPCWQCREQVVVGASKCPHCGADLVWNQPSAHSG